MTLAALTGATVAIASLLGCSAIERYMAATSAPMVVAKPAQTRYLYDALLFEIAPVDSALPDPAALGHFKSLLERYRICRAEAVVFMLHFEVPRPLPFWNSSIIDHYEFVRREHYDPDQHDRVGIIFVPYLRGRFIDSDGTHKLLGGLQYGRTAFAIWKDGAGDREGAVLLHEMLHLIGVKKDAMKPRFHCDNENCVLWTWAKSPYSVLCDDCEAELAKIIEERWGR